MSRRRAVLTTAAFVLLGAGALPLFAQARKLDPIRRPPRPQPPAEAPREPVPTTIAPSPVLPPIPLPTAAACEDAVRRVAASYEPSEIETILAANFPNRFELIDALRRASLRATNIELRVESVESTTILPWEIIEQRPARDGTIFILASDCITDVRTRLIFDDPATGERTVGELGRGEWRIRFTHHAVRRPR
ncbi:MAG TPA: hypothetical protein VM557_00705 [Thermoanaerobaculia bacterium]|nr:hypothetical protein [Thermoanaerobaculia bacterium]